MTRYRTLILPIAALAVLIAVSACSQSASTTPSSAPSTAASSAQPGGPGGFPGGGDFTKIQQCLEAAGLSLPTGSFAPPSGAIPSGRIPTGSFPAGPFPSGGFPGGSFAPPGGLGGGLSDPKIQQALAACGISLPNVGPAPSN